MKSLFKLLSVFALYALTSPTVSAQNALANLNVGSCSSENSVFQAETDWLQLTEQQVLGQVTAVAVDNSDHVWILHRPNSVADGDIKYVLPPVVEFDANGRFIQAFGGPGEQYEWPDKEHSLAVSASGQVWVGGSEYQNLAPGRGDHMLLVFNTEGQFIRQIGKRGESEGNLDTENLNAPADIYIDDVAQEAYVADGYGNQRVIVFSTEDGRFLRMWSAFGLEEFPDASAYEAGITNPGFNGVHGVEMSDDGILYVSDRLNQRIQLFLDEGVDVFFGQVEVNPEHPSPQTASGITFSADESQKYMFVVDWGNNSIEVFDRLTLDHVGRIGKSGSRPGEFLGPHLIDTDSQGNLYIAEVQGKRLQRLIPCNTENGAVTW